MPPQNDRQRDRRSNEAGNRQQQNSTANRPWGHGKAVIRISDDKSIFVNVGAVWETEQGNLQLILDCEPNQWRDPHVRRAVVLMKSDAPTERSR